MNESSLIDPPAGSVTRPAGIAATRRAAHSGHAGRRSLSRRNRHSLRDVLIAVRTYREISLFH
ncbi:MAG TPA: hypothetical protein PKI32_04985 [Opitutales bacterium]|nr:hypothetical protein [Opitutales bacterium]